MTSIPVRVHGADQVGEARRAVLKLADIARLDETERGNAGIIATECASNILKHARDGILLARAPEGLQAVEIIALDRGPGMSSVGACMRDGYSTAGSPGTGLGAIQRLATEFDIYSTAGGGTAVLARVERVRRTGAAEAPAKTAAPLRVGAVSVPKLGETECGDGWAVRQAGGSTLILVVDGLGHGPMAAACAEAAVVAFRESESSDPDVMLEDIHLALRSTRGGAGAIACIEPHARRMRFAGVGNISAQVRSEASVRQAVSHPGILGHEARKVREFTYDWPEGAMLLIYSDGLSSHISLDGYAGLTAHDPALIAGVLYRDWNRGRDDATVVVAREAP